MKHVISEDDLLGLFVKPGCEDVMFAENGSGGCYFPNGEEYTATMGMGRSKSEWALQEFIGIGCQDGGSPDCEEISDDYVAQEEEETVTSDLKYVGEGAQPFVASEIETPDVSLDDRKPVVSSEAESRGVKTPVESVASVVGSKLEDPSAIQVSPLFQDGIATFASATGKIQHEILRHNLERDLVFALAQFRDRRFPEGLTASNGNGGTSGPAAVTKGAEDKYRMPPFVAGNMSEPQSAVDRRPKSLTSGSSEDEDCVKNGDSKHLKRMHSNRESARRSRSRKQAQLESLEIEVKSLRGESSVLADGLRDITKAYNEAQLHNRILKSDVEALRLKVTIAEDLVQKLGGQPPLAPTSRLLVNGNFWGGYSIPPSGQVPVGH